MSGIHVPVDMRSYSSDISSDLITYVASNASKPISVVVVRLYHIIKIPVSMSAPTSLSTHQLLVCNA